MSDEQQQYHTLERWAVRFDIVDGRDIVVGGHAIEFFFDDKRTAHHFLEFFTSNQFVNITKQNQKIESFYFRNGQVIHYPPQELKEV